MRQRGIGIDSSSHRSRASSGSATSGRPGAVDRSVIARPPDSPWRRRLRHSRLVRSAELAFGLSSGPLRACCRDPALPEHGTRGREPFSVTPVPDESLARAPGERADGAVSRPGPPSSTLRVSQAVMCPHPVVIVSRPMRRASSDEVTQYSATMVMALQPPMFRNRSC